MKDLARRSLRLARLLHGRHVYRHQLRLLTWWRVGRHHAAPIDPLRNLSVDPASIEHFFDLGLAAFVKIRAQPGVVVPGDWDLDVTPLSEQFVYQSVHAHFVEGVPWDRTYLHEVAMEGIRAGKSRYHGCTTVEDLEHRLSEIERLYERVRSEGYRSQTELLREFGQHPLQQRKPRPPELEEVIVDVARDGSFIFLDGVHRLSVAAVAGVPRIPVAVLRRHTTWQAFRDRVAKDPGAFPATTFEHPDLAVLRPKDVAARVAVQRSR